MLKGNVVTVEGPYARKGKTVSQEEQDRRFREATIHEASHGGSLRQVRARVRAHKLYGVTH
jgi:hypothetical protein